MIKIKIYDDLRFSCFHVSIFPFLNLKKYKFGLTIFFITIVNYEKLQPKVSYVMAFDSADYSVLNYLMSPYIHLYFWVKVILKNFPI